MSTSWLCVEHSATTGKVCCDGNDVFAVRGCTAVGRDMSHLVYTSNS